MSRGLAAGLLERFLAACHPFPDNKAGCPWLWPGDATIRVPGVSFSFTLLQEFHDSLDRNFNPGRAVVQLIANFVNRFFKQMRPEQSGEVIGFLRQKRGASDRLQVSFQEGSAAPLVPKSSPWLNVFQVLLLDVSQFQLLKQSRVGSVIERSNHAGHIPHRRPLDTSFAQGPGWLTFKINDHEVFAGVENLA